MSDQFSDRGDKKVELTNADQIKLAFASLLEEKGLTLEEMQAFLAKTDMFPGGLISKIKQDATRVQSEKSLQWRQSRARLNAITSDIIDRAVHELAAGSITPTRQAVSQRVDELMNAGGKIATGLWSRLGYHSEDPIIRGQQGAYEIAVEETRRGNIRKDVEPAIKPPKPAGNPPTPGSYLYRRERLNSITPEVIQNAVRALRKSDKNSTIRAVALYIDGQMGADGKVQNGLYNRLHYGSDNPIIVAQKEAYNSAVSEIDEANKAQTIVAPAPHGSQQELEEAETGDREQGAEITTKPGANESTMRDEHRPSEEIAELKVEKPGQDDVRTAEPPATIPVTPSITVTSQPPPISPTESNSDRGSGARRPISWRQEQTPQENMKVLADNIEAMLVRLHEIKKRNWIKTFAPSAINNLESRLNQWDNALLDLEETVTATGWGDEKEREYRKIRAHLQEIEKELDEIGGRLST